MYYLIVFHYHSKYSYSTLYILFYHISFVRDTHAQFPLKSYSKSVDDAYIRNLLSKIVTTT